jgi:beta-galactosidase
MRGSNALLVLAVSASVTLMAAAGAVFSAAGGNAPPLAVAAITDAFGRDRLFNEQWKFFKGDDATAQDPAFNDAAWRTLDLPHDWSAEGSFDRQWASGTGYLPCGLGWYRKTFTVPAGAAGKSISIRFDGVMDHSTVWCNGKQVGDRAYGYSSFTCDLTPAIKFGGANVIAVRVDHSHFADSRWYAGSGIYRNVFLGMTDKVHVDTYGTFVTTPQVAADSADVNVQTFLKNDGSAAADVTLVTAIKDAKGGTVATMEQGGSVPPGGQTFKSVVKIPRPELWSPDHPIMYGVQTQVKMGGAAIDQYTTPFGIRTFNFDPAKGFSINGQSMKLKGVCLHHDAGALGAAVPIQVWERRFKLLKDAGCNAIRCSHNPPAPEFLDLCDRMGFLVMDEAFDEWTGPKNKWVTGRNNGTAAKFGYAQDFEKWADIDIRDMVLRDRNHPSIIMWSIGNEIDYTNDPWPSNSPALPPIAERLIKDVKAVDTTRPVTAACAFPAANLFKGLLDIEGYNYMEQRYAGDHAANPNRVIYGSENSHALNTWQAVAQNDFIAGQFLWTGIDYLGEAGGFPNHGSSAGMINLAGFPKNQYYFRQSLWSDVPMVYLFTGGFGGRGRGGGVPGRGATGGNISCYTNCDNVELFHDGQSLGSKPHAPGETTTWQVDFTSGVLKAVGKKGTATAAFELKKAGAAAKLALRPDWYGQSRPGLQAKGDVAQIEVDVTDQDGTLVPDAANLITCALSGPARLLGIENGNLNGIEDNKGLTHSVFQGRMMVYVQATQSSGEIKLSVSAPNLEAASLALPVR